MKRQNALTNQSPIFRLSLVSFTRLLVAPVTVTGLCCLGQCHCHQEKCPENAPENIRNEYAHAVTDEKETRDRRKIGDWFVNAFYRFMYHEIMSICIMNIESMMIQ